MGRREKFPQAKQRCECAFHLSAISSYRVKLIDSISLNLPLANRGYSLTPSGLQRYTLFGARTRAISYHDMRNLHSVEYSKKNNSGLPSDGLNGAQRLNPSGRLLSDLNY